MSRDWGDDDQAPGGHERWLVTYADLITLLLVFFIVMYALSSRISGEKFDALASSLATSMKKTSTPKPSDRSAYSRDDSKQTRKFKATADAVIESVIKTDPKSDVKIDIDQRGLIVSLIDTSFFDSGSSLLKPGGAKVLWRVAGSFKKLPNNVRIEGHTDSIPIHTARFPTNWELSSARATAIVRFLSDKVHIPAHRLSAVAYAEQKPIASNGNPEGRKRNRRVDIIVERDEDSAPIGPGLPMDAPTMAPTVPKATEAPKKGFNNPFQ